MNYFNNKYYKLNFFVLLGILCSFSSINSQDCIQPGSVDISIPITFTNLELDESGQVLNLPCNLRVDINEPNGDRLERMYLDELTFTERVDRGIIIQESTTTPIQVDLNDYYDECFGSRPSESITVEFEYEISCFSLFGTRDLCDDYEYFEDILPYDKDFYCKADNTISFNVCCPGPADPELGPFKAKITTLSDVKIFYNQNSQNIEIQNIALKDENFTVTLSSIDGKMLQKATHLDFYKSNLTLNGGHLNNGTYIISIASEKERVARKVIILN